MTKEFMQAVSQAGLKTHEFVYILPWLQAEAKVETFTKRECIKIGCFPVDWFGWPNGSECEGVFHQHNHRKFAPFNSISLCFLNICCTD